MSEKYKIKDHGDYENMREAATKTLEALGYTYHGGVLWKPPIGRGAGVVTFEESLKKQFPCFGNSDSILCTSCDHYRLCVDAANVKKEKKE